MGQDVEDGVVVVEVGDGEGASEGEEDVEAHGEFGRGGGVEARAGRDPVEGGVEAAP